MSQSILSSESGFRFSDYDGIVKLIGNLRICQQKTSHSTPSPTPVRVLYFHAKPLPGLKAGNGGNCCREILNRFSELTHSPFRPGALSRNGIGHVSFR
jgi:hypothetical protein